MVDDKRVEEKKENNFRKFIQIIEHLKKHANKTIAMKYDII